MTTTTVSADTATDPSAEPGRWRGAAGWAITLGRVSFALFLISAGLTKFTGGHIFQYIEYRSGIDVFFTWTNVLVGAAEVLAGALVLVPRTRRVGGGVALVVMTGAVAFHLSPWLGVSVPTGLTDGATAPWTADDFSSTTSPVPFVLAVVSALVALLIARSGRPARSNALADVE